VSGRANGGTARRRRRAPRPPVLVAVAGIGLLAVVGLTSALSGSPDAAPPRAPSTATIAQAQARAGVATTTATAPANPPPAPSAERMIGQKIMVGFRGSAEPPRALLKAIKAGRVGGVILFSENTGGAAGIAGMVRRLQGAARAGGNPRLLIASDQEGGDVKRIASAPPTLSPRQMGQAGAATARAQGAATGRALHALGINVDLAPVSDVPDSSRSFLGTRTFGSTATVVSATAGAFARGVQSAGVAATAKHYPGLGTTGASNTDTAVVRVGTGIGELTARAKPFHALVDDGIHMVMVSNAIYTSLDADRPAVLSKSVVRTRLRRFFPDGVVISDALEAPAVKRTARASRCSRRTPTSTSCSTRRPTRRARSPACSGPTSAATSASGPCANPTRGSSRSRPGSRTAPDRSAARMTVRQSGDYGAVCLRAGGSHGVPSSSGRSRRHERPPTKRRSPKRASATGG
jgi:beta-N-acetylhexosaminidase